MAVRKVGEKYRCSICHNEVTITKAGGGANMVRIEENGAVGSTPD